MKVRDTLARVELEIYAAERKFEQSMADAERKFQRSIAELRGQRDELRRDYAHLLKAELARVEGQAGGTRRARALTGDARLPDAAAVVALLERAGGTLTTAQIREFAGVPRSVPFASMNQLMRTLVADGQVVREGRARGTRYRLPSDRDAGADQPRGETVAGVSERAVPRRSVDVGRVALSEC